MKNVFESELDITKLHESFKETLEKSFTQLKDVLEVIDETEKDRVKTILQEIDSVHTAINKIDQFIKINYMPPTNWSKIDLREPLLKSIENNRDLAKLKNITFKTDICQNECRAYGNTKILQEFVFDHLINNAIKFSPNDCVVEIKLKTEKRIHHFSIEDHGIGIEGQYLKKIRETNLRYYHPDTEGHIGSGLSIPIIKRIMKKLNGSMAIQSQTNSENRGTTISLKFHQF